MPGGWANDRDVRHEHRRAEALLLDHRRVRDAAKARGTYGVRAVDPVAVREARHRGTPVRLVGRVALDGDRVSASVAPEPVPAGSALAVSGTTLVTHYDAEVFPGGLTVTSGAPDLSTTAYGLFADFLEVIGAT